MPDSVPEFRQLNLVVGDMDAALAFYRTLGACPSAATPATGHPGAGPATPRSRPGTARPWSSTTRRA
jgi:hypothetical protein